MIYFRYSINFLLSCRQLGGPFGYYYLVRCLLSVLRGGATCGFAVTSSTDTYVDMDSPQGGWLQRRTGRMIRSGWGELSGLEGGSLLHWSGQETVAEREE